ncbi:MAG: hypothetical protein ABSE48_08200 [Verrucomicrobiota bacterium]|jgi:hypothetical protein
MKLLTFLLLVATSPVVSAAPTPAASPASPDTSAQAMDYMRATEAIRAICISGRRIICGKIVKVLPGGFIVDSGYTNLMRHALSRAWLIPGTVEAERRPNQIEKNEPDAVCIGLVYLTDTPRSRRGKPKLLDYVDLQAFPAGQFTYNSVGTLQRTVRHYCAGLPAAVQLNRLAAGIRPPFQTAVVLTNSLGK